jgi:uncharacterized membrane-anchored protein
MAFTEHPLRRWTVNEMHLRRFGPVSENCDIYQIVRLLNADQRADEDRWLISNSPAFSEWNLAPRHGYGRTSRGVQFLWERHTEATTITLIFEHHVPEDVRAPFIQWLEGWPGEVVRATRLFVLSDQQKIDAQLSKLEFAKSEIVHCMVNAELRIWSDFSIHANGYGQLVISAGSVDAAERGRIVQRVQELGNYRNLALLGFPLVQEYGPQLDRVEEKLADHARRVAQSTSSQTDEDDDLLLNDLAQISSELEMIRSATGFRLSATAAYAEVAADRIRALNVVLIPNFQSLVDFTERRLVPASRTCVVFRQRLNDIAERVAAIMHTLDVRIDSRIKAQNLALMRSMERSTQLQFRLQTLVEGLSVIAAAYYLIGLVAYLAKGVTALPTGWSNDVFIAAITIPVIMIIFLFVRKLRNKVLNDTKL